MAFFNSAVTVLQTLVIALGRGTFNLLQIQFCLRSLF